MTSAQRRTAGTLRFLKQERMLALYRPLHPFGPSLGEALKDLREAEPVVPVKWPRPDELCDEIVRHAEPQR